MQALAAALKARISGVFHGSSSIFFGKSVMPQCGFDMGGESILLISMAIRSAPRNLGRTGRGASQSRQATGALTFNQGPES
jgi:hypothetical protein